METAPSTPVTPWPSLEAASQISATDPCKHAEKALDIPVLLQSPALSLKNS
jgi:hypothetical protein